MTLVVCFLSFHYVLVYLLNFHYVLVYLLNYELVCRHLVLSQLYLKLGPGFNSILVPPLDYVDIPYPFGIGPDDSPDHCSLPGFNPSCRDDGRGALRPFHKDVKVLNISLQRGQPPRKFILSTKNINTL